MHATALLGVAAAAAVSALPTYGRACATSLAGTVVYIGGESAFDVYDRGPLAAA